MFEQVRGVTAVESGYCNGHVRNPTYEQVRTGDTGHVEAIRVNYDPQAISLRELLEISFVIHDSTSLNRQGADAGTQVCSGIYHRDAEQQRVAAEVNAATGNRVVTELVPEDNDTRAGADHQHDDAQHPNQGYCAMVVAPKIAKFRKTFNERIRSDAIA